MVDLGPLDKNAVVYTNTQTKGLGGAVKDNRVVVCRLYVSQLRPRATAVLAGGRDASQLDTVYRGRFTSQITQGMELVVEGKRYRIIADPTEPPDSRRDAIDMFCRAIT